MPARKYRFRLDLGTITRVVHPVYKKTASKDYEREANQQFFREALSERITFSRNDYDLIMAQPYAFRFFLYVDRQLSDGSYELEWLRLTFTRSDCKLDADKQTAIVQPLPLDQYYEFMNNVNKEFNLIELGPERVEVDLKLRSVLQIYIQESGLVTNIVNGNSWTQPFDRFAIQGPTDLTNTFNFAFAGAYDYIPGASGAALVPDVSGLYKDGTRVDGVYEQDVDASQAVIRRVSDQVIVYRATSNETNFPLHTNPTITYASETSDSVCAIFNAGFYARIVTTADQVDGQNTVDMADLDPAPVGPRFNKVIGVDLGNSLGDNGGAADDMFVFHDGNSATSSGFGRFASSAANFGGLYFTKPSLPGGGTGDLYPLAQNEWTGFSLWFYYQPAFLAIQEASDEDYTIRHCYKLAEVMRVMLEVTAPNVTHSELPEFSDFLYGPSNPIKTQFTYPIITPTSNFTKSDYNREAQRAMIRWSDILAFFRDFYQAFIFIDDNKLKVEHLDFYERGKTYVGTNVGTDTTTLINPRTTKPWSHKNNKWEYDKGEMPEQITPGWANQSSDLFRGFPIDIIDEAVQLGNLDERIIGKFSSDVDFMHAAGDQVSPDGFVFLECLFVSDRYTVPIVDLVYQGQVRSLQNGYASFYYAHDKYWRHGLPSQNVILNGVQISASSVKKNRMQNSIFPNADGQDPMELVNTALGEGRITKLSINLSSGVGRSTLKHDTE